jgi:cyclophilin family peptidyl-prolyl cis-trans isomerase
MFRTLAVGLVGAALFAFPSARADDAAMPQARIETSLGTITIALDRTHAPATVANFIAYARDGHFDGTMIYRVEPGFVIQMGSFEASGASRPTRAPIALESGNGLSNVRGAVAMARAEDPASATAEFFVDLAGNTRLDAELADPPNTTGYAVFGHVTAGMGVVDRIAGVPLGATGRSRRPRRRRRPSPSSR